MLRLTVETIFVLVLLLLIVAVTWEVGKRRRQCHCSACTRMPGSGSCRRLIASRSISTT